MRYDPDNPDSFDPDEGFEIHFDPEDDLEDDAFDQEHFALYGDRAERAKIQHDIAEHNSSSAPDPVFTDGFTTEEKQEYVEQGLAHFDERGGFHEDQMTDEETIQFNDSLPRDLPDDFF